MSNPIEAALESEIPPELPLENPVRPDANLVDLLLRHPSALLARFEGPQARATLLQLAALALGGHLVYGLVIASFAGDMQWWASPLKVLMGITVSGAICFPSLYILVCLSGATASMAQVGGILLSLLALCGVFLAGFGPVAWIFSQSSNLVSFIATIHVLVWFTALMASARMLFLGMKHWRARGTEWAGIWMVILLVTVMQMATVLRPIVGESTQLFVQERKFFLQHWLETVQAETKGEL